MLSRKSNSNPNNGIATAKATTHNSITLEIYF